MMLKRRTLLQSILFLPALRLAPYTARGGVISFKCDIGQPALVALYVAAPCTVTAILTKIEHGLMLHDVLIRPIAEVSEIFYWLGNNGHEQFLELNYSAPVPVTVTFATCV
jgi:hypothetical protein